MTKAVDDMTVVRFAQYVIDNMTVAQFMQCVEDLELEPILDYDEDYYEHEDNDGWRVYKIGEKYFFCSRADSSLYEVKLLKCMPISEMRPEDIGDELWWLNDCYPRASITGEDNGIENPKYYWFD